MRKRWNNSKAEKVACLFADYTPVPGPVSQNLAGYWGPDPLSYMRLIFLYLSQCGGVSESYKQKIPVGVSDLFSRRRSWIPSELRQPSELTKSSSNLTVFFLLSLPYTVHHLALSFLSYVAGVITQQWM